MNADTILMNAMFQMPKKGKNAQSKKAQKSGGSCNEEESNGDMNPQSSCCYTSEDDSNGSQELKGAAAALNSNGKTRAGRGSATDPQSLYARVGFLFRLNIAFDALKSSIVRHDLS